MKFRILPAAIALAGVCAAQPTLRLPTDVRPLHYDADLRITPGQDHFTGAVTIQLDVARPVSTVWLHAKSLELREATIGNAPARVEAAKNDFISITPRAPLARGHATLQIVYSGEISRTLTDGAFMQQQGPDWYVFTKFEPVTARRVFPCFDEPSFKTPWKLTLHVPRDLKAFSNTAIAAEDAEPDGTKAVQFQETKPLPSYLVAFAIGPFDVVDTAPVGRNHVPSRIIVPKGRAEEAAYAASITPKLIEMLEGYFGMPYPYDKLEQIVVPVTTAWGAMENAALIAYGDFLLTPRGQDSELLRENRALTMEHEMSHQWFGDLVTMQWWNDLWLNEAFASWLCRKLVDEWKPEWQIRADAARGIGIMRADSLTSARKIRQPIEAPGDIANAFDGITYGKGEAVIGMFENYVGDENFRRAIREYLREHAFGNATSEDLLHTLDAVGKPGAGAAFATFLNQVGFPVVNVALRCDGPGPRVDLEQQRFLPAGSNGIRSADWDVPVCARWPDNGAARESCFLLTKSEASFPLPRTSACPGWLFADANAAGYYAVVYTPELARTLANEGLPHLNSVESAAALRNVQLSFTSGVGNPEQDLTFLAQFSRSADAGLVRQAAGALAGVDDFVPTALRGNYARLIRSLYGARAHELGWQPKPNESHETHLLRLAILPLVAIRGEDRELREEADALARRWLKDHHSLDPDTVEDILFTAAWTGNRAFFDQLVEEIRTTKSEREKQWMIGAVAGFQDPEITRAALSLLFDGGIDVRNLQYLLFDSTADTRETIWAFAQQNFDRLNAIIPGARGIPFGATLPGVAAGFCDAAHAAEVERFFRPRIPDLPGGERHLNNALERIRLCDARAQIIRPAIVDFLKNDAPAAAQRTE